MLILILLTIIKTDKRLLGFLAFFFFLPVMGLSREHVKESPRPAPVVAEPATVVTTSPHDYFYPGHIHDHPRNNNP